MVEVRAVGLAQAAGVRRGRPREEVWETMVCVCLFVEIGASHSRFPTCTVRTPMGWTDGWFAARVFCALLQVKIGAEGWN